MSSILPFSQWCFGIAAAAALFGLLTMMLAMLFDWWSADRYFGSLFILALICLGVGAAAHIFYGPTRLRWRYTGQTECTTTYVQSGKVMVPIQSCGPQRFCEERQK
jgi:hypothetical protein